MRFPAFLLFALLSTLLVTACVGEDFVEDYVQPELRLLNPVDSLEFGTTYQFDVQFFNNIGQPEEVDVRWATSAPDVLTITDSGLATAVSGGGVTVTASYQDEFGETATLDFPVGVGEETIIIELDERTGSLRGSGGYVMEGDFVLEELESGDLKLSFGDDYVADDGLPGLYVYLSNNANSKNGALEIGRVQTFEGSHEYVISGDVGIRDYAYVLYFCKPFNVKVGDGEMID